MCVMAMTIKDGNQIRIIIETTGPIWMARYWVNVIRC